MRNLIGFGVMWLFTIQIQAQAQKLKERAVTDLELDTSIGVIFLGTKPSLPIQSSAVSIDRLEQPGNADFNQTKHSIGISIYEWDTCRSFTGVLATPAFQVKRLNGIGVGVYGTSMFCNGVAIDLLSVSGMVSGGQIGLYTYAEVLNGFGLGLFSRKVFVNGLQLAPFSVIDTLNGAAVSVVGGAQMVKGGYIAMISSNKRVYGFTGGVLLQIVDEVRGVSAAPFNTIIDNHGLQIGAINNATLRGLRGDTLLRPCNYGVQLALGNYSDKNSGVQLGLVNYANHNNGLQIGLVNFSADGKVMPFVKWW